MVTREKTLEPEIKPLAEASHALPEESIATLAEKLRRHPLLGRFRMRKLRMGFSERRVLLAVGDLVAVNLAFGLYLMTFYSLDFFRLLTDFQEHQSWFVSLSLMWVASAVILDSTNLVHAARPATSQSHASAAVLLASLLFFLTPFVTLPLPPHRHQLLLLPVAGMAVVSLWRFVFAWLFAVPSLFQRCLVVGAGRAGRTFVRTLSKHYGNGNRPGYFAGQLIVGFIDDDPAKQGGELEGLPVLGTCADLPRLVRELEVDEVVVAITHSETIRPPLFQAILNVRELGLNVVAMTDFFEQATGRVPVEHAGRNLHVVMPLRAQSAPRLLTVGKRLADVVGGFLGCILVLLVAPFIWLANRLTDRGPLFYTQQRVGEAGRPFRILKFRSMVVDAEQRSGGAVWAHENDDRITLVGKFLRRTRLDELPQFWNVFLGEMSLIGPRPERPEFVWHLARTIPFYRLRHAVKPGMTGWAQVKYRYAASAEDALTKLQYDLYYIKHRGVLLELRILLLTFQIVVGFKGR